MKSVTNSGIKFSLLIVCTNIRKVVADQKYLIEIKQNCAKAFQNIATLGNCLVIYTTVSIGY